MADAFSARLGCSADPIPCMRAITDPDVIVAEQASGAIAPLVNAHMLFGLVVDGHVLVETIAESFARGRPKPEVPLLIGHNSGDAGLRPRQPRNRRRPRARGEHLDPPDPLAASHDGAHVTSR